MKLKHLKEYNRLNEALEYEDIVDLKGDMPSILDLLSFDNTLLDISDETFTELIDNDFELFIEFMYVMCANYDKIHNKTTRDSGNVIHRSSSRISNILFNDYSNTAIIRKALIKLLINGEKDKFDRVIELIYPIYAAKSNTHSIKLFNSSQDGIDKYLNNTELLNLSRLNLIKMPPAFIMEASRDNPISIQDIKDNANSLKTYVVDKFRDNPANVTIDLNFLKEIVKYNFELFLELIDVYKYLAVTKLDNILNNDVLIYSNQLIRGIFEATKTELKTVNSNNYSSDNRGTVGPHIFRIISALIKANRFDDILRIHETIKPYVKHGYDGISSSLPLTVSNIEKLFNTEQIKILLDRSAIHLSTSDRKRLLEAHDQYYLYTNSPLYNTLINTFGLSDSTTNLVKKNGNIRFNSSRDEYSCHSYGEVRRVGVSGITIKAGINADNAEGINNMFEKFGQYLCRNAYTMSRKDNNGKYGTTDPNYYANDVRQYVKQNPIKSRAATLNDWLPWYNNLYEYLAFNSGESALDIGNSFNHDFEAPRYKKNK